MSQATLVGHHFAKTGGTSIGAHVVLNLDRAQHYPYGRHNATKRLYNCKPLLEEYAADDVAKLRFVFGHDVNASILGLLPHNNIELFAVCRHPVARFVSSYKHFLRNAHLRKRGRDQGGEHGRLSARRVFKRQHPSPFAHEILRRYELLADPNASSDKEKLISILQTMRFVISTEMLNERSVGLFATIGLPPLSEQRRAYNETVDLGDLHAEEIMSRDHLDMMVYEAVNDAWTSANAAAERRNNPFGYQPERLATARRALADQQVDPKRAVEQAYFRLFAFHLKSGRLHASKVFLEHSGLSSAREAFAAFCAKKSLRLDSDNLPAREWCYVSDMYSKLKQRGGQQQAAEAALAVAPDSSLANLIAGRAAAQRKDFKEAIRLLRKAVELNPIMQEGWYWLARASWQSGDIQVAADSIAKAIQLKPDAKPFRNLHEAIADSRRDHELVIPAE